MSNEEIFSSLFKGKELEEGEDAYLSVTYKDGVVTFVAFNPDGTLLATEELDTNSPEYTGLVANLISQLNPESEAYFRTMLALDDHFGIADEED